MNDKFKAKVQFRQDTTFQTAVTVAKVAAGATLFSIGYCLITGGARKLANVING